MCYLWNFSLWDFSDYFWRFCSFFCRVNFWGMAPSLGEGDQEAWLCNCLAQDKARVRLSTRDARPAPPRLFLRRSVFNWLLKMNHISKEEETQSMINGNSTESECFPYWWCAYAHPVSERSDCWTGFDPRITIVGQLHQDRPKPGSSLAPSKLFNFSF